MFTYDFEPILDIAYNLKRNFTNSTVTFIQNKENRLTEINIEKQTYYLAKNSFRKY